MSSPETKRRPIKVWSCDRQTRKAVVVSSLKDLKDRGGERLGYSGLTDVTAVLECDGTEVGDEEHFQTLVRDTTVLLLRPSEKWLPPGVEALRAVSALDEVDSASNVHPLPLGTEPKELINLLKADFSYLLLFNEEQLEAVANSKVENTANLFERQKQRVFQEACDRLLVDSRMAKEAHEAVELVKELCTQEDVSDGPRLSLPNKPKPGDSLLKRTEMYGKLKEAQQLLNDGTVEEWGPSKSVEITQSSEESNQTSGMVLRHKRQKIL